MAGPSPVVVEFLTKDLDKVLKGLKDIADHVGRVERASKAAANARASDEEKASKKSVQAAAKAVAQTQTLLSSSEKAGTQKLSAELRTRLQNQVRHLNAEFDAKKKAREKDLKDLEASRARAYKGSENYWRTEIAKSDAAERAKASASKRHVKDQISAQRQLELEQKRARLEMKRGVVAASASVGPQARLQVLRDAMGKSPEHMFQAVERVRDMSDENKALISRKNKELAEFRKAEKEKTDTAKREAKERAKAEQLANEQRVERRQVFVDTASSVGRGVRNAAIGGAAVAGGLFRTVTSLGGGFSVQDSIQERVNLERQSALIGVKSGQNGRELLDHAKAASIRTGTDADAVLRGMEGYGDKSGDWAGARDNAEFFAKYAKVTGSDTKDVGTFAGMLAVQNKDLQGKDNSGKLRQLTLDMMQMSRAGAVDVPELIQQVHSITKSSSSYVGDQTKNQRSLIGMSQVGIRTGSTAEAATALTNLSSDIIGHSKEAEAFLGKDIFDEKHNINMAPEELVGRILDRTGGDQEKLMRMDSDKTVITKRTMKYFQAVLPEYQKAEKKALSEGKSKEEAKAIAKTAAMGDQEKFIKASMTPEQMEQDFATIMKTSAEQFEGAVRELKQQVGEQLLPVLKDLVPVLRDATPTIVSFLKGMTEMAAWAAQNPLAAAVIGLGASISKELLGQIAAAGVNTAVEKGLTSALSGASGLAVGIGTAAIAITAATLAIAKMSEEENQRQNKGVGTLIEGANDVSALRAAREGKSPEEMKKAVEKAKADADALENNIQDDKAKKGGSKWYAGAAMVGATVADMATFGRAHAREKVGESFAETKRIDQQRIDEEIEQHKKLTDAIAATEKAMKALAAATPTAPPPSNNPADPKHPGRGFAPIGSPRRPER